MPCSSTPFPCGDLLSPFQLTVCQVSAEFFDVMSLFLSLPGCINLIEHHIDTPPGRGGTLLFI